MKTRGFTLTELLIVLSIISILAIISIPAYIGQQKRAARAEAFTNLESLRLLEEQFFAENGVYAPTAGGTINYNATPGVADNGIEDVLPGFQPGGCTACAAPFGLNYTYAITQNFALTSPVPVPFAGGTVAQNPCFFATATGVAGTRVAGDVFTIDCNNNKNF